MAHGWLISGLHIILPIVLLLAAIGLRVNEPRWFLQLQLTVFDSFNRLKPRSYQGESGVRIVDIDDETLERHGQWPWPRTRVAELIFRLNEMGAATTVFDIVFAEPDRTSPKTVVELWPELPEFDELRARVREMPDHDTVLAEIVAGVGNVVTGFVLTSGRAPRVPVACGNFAMAGDDASQFVQVHEGAVANLTEIAQAAAGNGNFNMVPEGDGLIRRVPLIMGFQDRTNGEVRLYPAIALEALRVVQGASTMIIKSSGASGETAFGEKTGISSVKVGQFVVPTDANGRFWVRYTGHQPKRYIPAWKILDGSADPSLVQDHIVLVGASAAGLLDLRATPLDAVLPGVEVHAEIIEQILDQDFIRRPDWAVGAEIIYMLIIGLALVVLLPRIGALACAFAGSIVVAGALGFSWYAYDVQRLLFNPVYPSVAVLGVYLSSSLINFMRTEAEKRQVRGAFSQYLSPALVEQLAQHPDRLQLGGETREMTFLFCDVRGFTAISEMYKENPQGLTLLINRFLKPLTDVILAREGTIDKYMGDCIMAFWNAPLDVSNHADHACESAMAMFEELERLNEERSGEAEADGEKFLPLNIGIGVNTGECVVGNMGWKQRFDYSVLGDAVNLASRLEGQSKTYGVGTVIGPETAEQVDGRFATLELDLIAVKGKVEAVRIFALLGDAIHAASPEFNTLRGLHEQMISTYRTQDWEGAKTLLQQCRACANGTLDELYMLYEERIAEYSADPPGTDWDGVYIATSK